MVRSFLALPPRPHGLGIVDLFGTLLWFWRGESDLWVRDQRMLLSLGEGMYGRTVPNGTCYLPLPNNRPGDRFVDPHGHCAGFWD